MGPTIAEATYIVVTSPWSLVAVALAGAATVRSAMRHSQAGEQR